jgi:hypothetical protein
MLIIDVILQLEQRKGVQKKKIEKISRVRTDSGVPEKQTTTDSYKKER